MLRAFTGVCVVSKAMTTAAMFCAESMWGSVTRVSVEGTPAGCCFLGTLLNWNDTVVQHHPDVMGVGVGQTAGLLPGVQVSCDVLSGSPFCIVSAGS